MGNSVALLDGKGQRCPALHRTFEDTEGLFDLKVKENLGIGPYALGTKP